MDTLANVTVVLALFPTSPFSCHCLRSLATNLISAAERKKKTRSEAVKPAVAEHLRRTTTETKYKLIKEFLPQGSRQWGGNDCRIPCDEL